MKNQNKTKQNQKPVSQQSFFFLPLITATVTPRILGTFIPLAGISLNIKGVEHSLMYLLDICTSFLRQIFL